MSSQSCHTPAGAFPVHRHRWRPMSGMDIPAVHALASATYPDLPEEEAVYRERLTLFPTGCHVLAAGDEITGYVVAHPWVSGRPPALNRLIGSIPRDADCLYLHDIALRPELRGVGHARQIVSTLIDATSRRQLPRVELVALSGTASFWTSCGFRAATNRDVEASTYGSGAALMFRAPPTS